MTVDDLLAYLRGSIAEACICGQVIPDTAIYYGFPLSDDADAPMAFVNEWHDQCLNEWGFERCHEDDPEGILGIKHRHYEDAAA